MKEGWTYQPFGDSIKITMGQSPSSDTYNNLGTGLPFFQGNADFGKEHPNVRVYCDTPIRIAERDDILISVRAPIGAINIADRKCCIGRGLASVRSNDGINNRFIFYFLQASKEHLISLGTGSTFKSIGKDSLSGLQFPILTLSEQERIVAELDLLQGIIDKQKAQLKELDTLAQSIFCDMFQHEHGQVVKLHDVCSIVSGLVNPNEEPYCNYPHIGGANIESGTGVFINVKLAKEENLISGKYLFDETMILYSKIRPNLNKVALPSFVGICSADMYPIIPDRDRIDRTFLKFVLSQPDFLEYAISHSGRANIPKINREDLMDYSFMSYSLSLQLAFATKIEAIEHQKASINASIAETQKLFDYTMDKYFG